ncbi:MULTISPECIES: GTP-binding protein [Klebsiella/Raoultella group]|uniref:ATP-binding protein n=1 Tax=Klebsiella electrica TaxID=1259973 RepID=A0AAJ5UG50_9ENTR|nr:ATP-binding protein [Klebsiella electrica]WBW63621.1 ATP-binding protein [Klebsiella electrica]
MMKDYKVILVGRSGSGKTTAIRSVSEINVVSTDVLASDRGDAEKDTTTVGFDYGELTIPGGQNRMRLYGTPGQERFTFMRDILERGSVGILLLADNHRPDPLAETRSWLRALKTGPLAGNAIVLLGIVKCDLSPLPDLEQYQRLLREEGLTLPVATLDARSPERVLFLLKVLFCQLERARNEEVYS